MIGTIVAGRYEIRTLIGSGGMANVYLAWDQKMNRIVALKMLKDEHREDAEFVRRFENEAKAVLTLSHPNIVKSYDVGDADGNYYIALEYVEGKTLKQIITDGGPLAPRTAVNLACQVLDALEHAHSCGFIHRDVKPQNVIVTSKGKAKLADFGIARDAAATTRTFAGTNVIGSVHYISPEQAKGEDVTAESDIYSCAIMLYEMLTGSVPFAGDNSVAIALKHLQEELVPPAAVNPRISRALSDVVVKAAAKEPEKRYKSAKEMKADLQRALREPHGTFAKIRGRTARERKKNRGIVGIGIVLMAVLAVFTCMFFIVQSWRESDMKAESEYIIPSFLGKTLDEARELAELRGFVLSVSDFVLNEEYPEGKIVSQVPASSAKGNKGDVVMVTVSRGSEYTNVPLLKGMALAEAAIQLEEDDLTLGNVDYVPSDLPEGQVVEQNPAAETRVYKQQAVDLLVSGTDEPVEMPSLVNLTVQQALEVVRDVGLEKVWMRFQPAPSSGHEELVAKQSPAATTGVSPKTLVEFWLNRSFLGNYAADIAVNLDILEIPRTVTVTAVMESGVEAVLYESEIQAGTQQPISFTGYLLTGGSRECIVYIDGEEARRITASFSLR